jgi:hypothetical protein
LHASVAALDCPKQATDSTALIWQLHRHVFGSSLHGDAGIAVLGNEPFEIKIALRRPFSRVQKLLMPLDLGFPFVLASMLARQGEPSFASILGPLKRFDRSGA